MPITEKQFKDYLMLYGADIENWPEYLQADSIRATYQPDMALLILEQERFDEMLLNERRFDPVNPNLAERIIHAARRIRKPASVSVLAWIEELLASVLPQPAFALATVLTLGIVLGLWAPEPAAGGNDSIIQTYFEDAGAIL